MNSEQIGLLKAKQQQIEEELQKWALENHLLIAGEQLVFELRIVSVPTVAGAIANEWYISPEEWDHLSKVMQEPAHRILFDLLRARNNEPVHRDEFAPDVPSSRFTGFKRHLDKIFREAGFKFYLSRPEYRYARYALRKIK